jgi:hypothetical protein
MSNVLGNISFQANDKMDVFQVAQVVNEGIEPSDNALLQIEESQFDSDKAWVTGNVPKMKPVHVEGDTSIINAWFKGESYQDPFVITVYVECETAEELEEVTADEEIEKDKRTRNDFLAPMEINL